MPEDDHQVIQTDRKCVWCDYSLRGLPETHRCPECGTRYDPDTQLFICHPQGRGMWKTFVGLLSCASLIFAAEWYSPGGKLALPPLAVAAVAALELIWRANWSGEHTLRILIDRTGVQLHSPRDGVQTFPWRDISRASINWVLGNVTLRHSNGSKIFSIPARDFGKRKTRHAFVTAIQEMKHAYLQRTYLSSATA